MLQAIGIVIFIVLASTVLGLLGTQLPPTLARGIPFLVPLVGLGAVALLVWVNGHAASDRQ